MTKRVVYDKLSNTKGEDKMRELTTKEQKDLVKMYRDVEKDLEPFPYLKTTEDFFKWRDNIKKKHGNNGRIRTKILEYKIEDNNSLMLLYNWSKFVRMVDRSIANVNMTKIDFGIVDHNIYSINPAGMLLDHLTKNKQVDFDRLFGLYRMEELELRRQESRLREVHTPEEYMDALVKEDEQTPWPIVPFIAMMKAYGIEGEDFLKVGRAVEQQGKDYIAEMIVNYEASSIDNNTTISVQHRKN